MNRILKWLPLLKTAFFSKKDDNIGRNSERIMGKYIEVIMTEDT